MTKEERELFLNFVDGKRKYDRSKNLVVKKEILKDNNNDTK